MFAPSWLMSPNPEGRREGYPRSRGTCCRAYFFLEYVVFQRERRAPRRVVRRIDSKRIAMTKSSWFTRFAQTSARLSGQPLTFMLAAGIVVVWAACGPVFHFGNTWQLVINTGTTIVTFLMVFLIQNTQNRDSAALQIKLDELIRATKEANDTVLNLEELDEKLLDRLRGHYCRLAERAREGIEKTLQEYESEVESKLR